MRIVVCVKHVPDLQSDRGYDAHGRTVRTAADGTLNEVDENAVEEALALRQAHGGEVIVLTVGPEVAAGAVRRALQMGADDAVHVSDEALAGSDYLGTARALGAAIEVLQQSRGPVDLVIAGLAALDGLGSVVPTMLATALGWPHLGVIQELSISGATVHANRELDGVSEVLECATPAVVAVTDLINAPRFPQAADILAARDKQITRWSLDDLGLDARDVGDAGAKARTVTVSPSPERGDPLIITDDDGDAGEQLAAYLADRDLI